MVRIAQLVESRIVIPVVVGSSPISHPRIQGLPIVMSEGLFAFREKSNTLIKKICSLHFLYGKYREHLNGKAKFF